MGMQRSIRFRKHRRRIKASGADLPLTSMMDVLVIIVVFLLKSYASTSIQFATVPGIKIPLSSSPDVPPETLQLIVTPEAMTFENEKILEFAQTPPSQKTPDGDYAFKPTDLTEARMKILPLYDALLKARNKAELLRAKSKARDASGNPLPFEGVLAIQADKRIRYDVLRKIMFTSATAGYRAFRFLAMKRPT